MNKTYLTRTLTALIVLVPVVVFVHLIIYTVAPAGERVVTHVVNERSPFIDAVLPAERVSDVMYTEGGEAYVEIKENPVYVSAHMPYGRFENIEVEIEFTSKNQPILEFGLLADPITQNYEMRPLNNELLNGLDWDTVGSDSGEVLYQKGNIFETIDDFRTGDSSRETLATYHANLNLPYSEPGYRAPLNEFQSSLEVSGSHKIVTYLSEGEFDLQLDYVDYNEVFGADDLVVTLRNAAGEIMNATSRIDGDVKDTQERSGTLELATDIFNEGIYTIEIVTTSDVAVSNITTNLRYLAFARILNLEKGEVELYTDANEIVFRVSDSEAVQDISIGNEEIQIEKTHTNYLFERTDRDLVRIVIPEGGVEIIANGNLAETREEFFNPDPLPLPQAASELEAQGIENILTTYQTPKIKEDWSVGSAVFKIPDWTLQEGGLKVTISAPRIENQDNAIVRIHAINLRYTKPPLTISNFLAELKGLLPFGL
jgi:hypothetical protein